jgi:thioredoxin
MKKIIKFWAPWCGPCRMYAPTFDKVADQYKDQVEFLNINVDEDTTGLAAEYKVKSIPYTVLVREDGTQLNKTGILSEIELQELILS